MAQRSEIATVYAAGLIQGIALVTFPAANAVFTNSSDYGLSSTEYGCMFIPQAATAVISSLLGAGLMRRFTAKIIYLVGLIANLMAMILLAGSQFAEKQHALAYGILLTATGCMGIGFGFTVPAVNTFASAFFPKKVDQAVLVLNALLGLGTALAPVFIAIFVGLGIWWGLPTLVGVLLVGLLLFSISQTLSASAVTHSAKTHKRKFPRRFWVFVSFALLYGVCETMNGNWAVSYMTKHFRASAFMASLTLGIFWSMVTAGRILFSSIGKWLPERMTYRVLPVVVAFAFVVLACVPKNNSSLGILAFALAGLGCSALLPLTISFGQKELTNITASAAGGLIAFYQIGYGIAAFGVGSLQQREGLNLKAIFGVTVVIALTMFALSFVVTQKSKPLT